MTRRKTGIGRCNPSEFGTVEERAGRYRAFYRVKGQVIRAPRTFEERGGARAWLLEQERSIHGGTWIDPRLAAGTVAAFSEDWLTGRTDLAPRTIEFYRAALDLYILPKLGHLTLSAVTPSKVNAWRAECLREATARAAEPHVAKENPVRAWAVTQGLQIAATGRIPAHVRLAWQEAGSPVQGGRKRQGDGSASVANAYRALKTILATAER